MARVLVADFLFVEAHRVVNLTLIRQIMHVSTSVSVLSVNGYYESYKEKFAELGISVIDRYVPGSRFGKIKGRLHVLRIMKEVASVMRRERFDAVISLAYDSIVAVLGKYFFCKTRVCLFNHKNIDDLKRFAERTLFRFYKNHYIHLVFENPFADYLQSRYGVRDVYVIPHPLIAQSLIVQDIQKYDCVALCNSNDENMLDALEKEYDPNDNSLTILARSKYVRESKGGLSFFKGFVEYEKYYSLLHNSRIVFVPLPESYRYRLSASIYDAFALRKKVITTSEFYATQLNSQYPGLCTYISEAKELLDTIRGMNDTCSESNRLFDAFLENHSDESIRRSLSKLFAGII